MEKIPDMTNCNYVFDYWNNRRMFEEFIGYVDNLCKIKNAFDEQNRDNKDFIAHLQNLISESVPYALNENALDELNDLVKELEKTKRRLYFLFRLHIKYFIMKC